jgi:hypothetical protein
MALGALCALCALGAAQAAPAIPAGSSAFPYGREVILLGPGGASRLAAWPGDARPRDSASFDGGFVAWERGSRSLLRWRGEGGLERLGRLEASQVFLSRDWALGKSELFSDGSGFSFTIYRITSRLERATAFQLDCFPSDCLFLGRRCYLAGADRADRKNSLYEIDLSTGRRRLLAELPKARDFGGLVSDGKRLWYYLSPAYPRKSEKFVLSFDLGAARGASAPRRLELGGIEAGGLSWYGSGFASGGRFWLPLASGEGAATRVSLYAFDSGGGLPSAVLPLPTGLYAPLAQAGDSFYAIGFLYVRDPGAFSLLAVRTGAGGAAVGAVALPLGSPR